MPEKVRIQNKEKFKEIYKILKDDDELDTDDENVYNKILYVSKMDDIYDWVTEAQNEIDEENARKIVQQKSSKWKFWKVFKKNQPEIEEMKKDLDIEGKDKDILPKSYVWLIVKVSFIKGSLELCKMKELSYDYESLYFSYENLYFESKLRLQGGSLNLFLDNLVMQSHSDCEVTTICEKLRPNKEPLVSLNVDFSPIDQPYAYCLNLNTEPIAVEYTPQALEMVKMYFMVPETQESVKTAAWDTLQGLQDTTKATLTDLLYGDTTYLIQIRAQGPHIRIPSPSQGSFLLNLGVVEIQNSENKQNAEYESLDFIVSGIKLTHELRDVSESVIPEFKVNLNINFLKSSHKALKWSSIAGSLDSFPDLIFEGELAEFRLIMNPSMYHNLKGVSDTFNVERVSLIENTNEIMKKSVMSSYVKRKSKNVQQWHSYYAVLSGGYIYFFLNEDAKTPTNYFYIKDCSLEDVYHLGVAQCIKLRNRYGECFLSCENEMELHFWKRSLHEQIIELESYKSVAKDQVEDVRTANKQRIKLAFQISVVNIILCNSQNRKVVEFELKRLSSEVIINPYDSVVNLSLLALHIRDMIRVGNEHFTVLAKSVTEGKDLITVRFRQFSPKSPKYSNKDLELEIAMGALEINWNPDFISTLLNFFEFADYAQPQKPISKKLIVKPDHVLLGLILHMECVTIYLNNVKQTLSIGMMTMSQMNSEIKIKDGGIETKGTLGCLKIYDLTNYPKTVQSTGKLTKLFSVRKTAPVMLEFLITTYHDGNPKKRQNINSEIEFKMNSVSIYYFSQPMMRIIDYLMYKVLGVIDSVSRVKNVYSFNSAYRLSALLGASVVKSINPESFPQKIGFSSVSISISNPILKFYPRPGYNEYFIADLGNIQISNRQELDSSRGSEEVWVDMYKVDMQNFTMKSLDQAIVSEFNLMVFIHRPVLTTAQSLDPEIDKSYNIRAKCGRLCLTFSQKDLTLLFKLMDLNFTYDDQLEEYINPKTYDPNINPTSKFMYFELEAKVLSVLFVHEDCELVEIFCANQKLKMWKYNNGSSVMNFTSEHLLGLIPEEAVISENPEHAEIAEAIFSISMDNIRNFEDFEDDDMRLSYVLFGPIGNIDPNKPTIQIDINTMRDGTKNIIIDITQLRLNLHVAAILQLQNFIFYAFPDYSSVPETPYDYMEKYRPREGMITKEIKTQYLAPELDMKLNIQEPIVLLPSIIHQRVLVVQSDFSYSFFRDSESMYLLRKTPNTIKSFEATHLEIYTCKLTELTKHSFTDIVKRKVLEPVEVIYKSTQMKISPKLSSFEVKYQMGAFLFTLSHKDMMLIGNIYSFQKEILQRESEIINGLKKTYGQKEDFLPRMSLDERNLNLRLSRGGESKDNYDLEATDEHECTLSIRSQTMQSENLPSENTSSSSLSISGVTLLLIYDTSVTFSPIIDTNATDLFLAIEEIGSDAMYKAGCMVKCNFYNPMLDIWEPFLEPVAIQLESMFSLDNNPETQGIIIIEKSTPLNINFSEIMLSHFLALAKGIKVKEDKLIREVVSPISIKNFSGCDLLIEKISLLGRNTGEVLTLKDGENKYIEVESMEMKAINLSQEYLNVTIISDQKTYSQCQQIPINKVQTLTKNVYSGQEEIPVIFDIELKDICKVFTVRSPIIIRNETAHDIKVLFSRKSVCEEKYCKSQESIPVPIPFVKNLMGVMPIALRAQEWSMTRLDEFVKDGFVKEMRVENFYVWIYTIIDQYNHNKITLCIRPPIVFRNQLPRSLTLQVFYGDGQNHKEISILSNGQHNEHSYSGSVDISVVFIVDNFKPTKHIRLLSKREKTPKSVKLKDYRKDILKVQIDFSKKGSQIFTFFCAFTLVNSTELPINFYYRKSSVARVVGGQNYVDNVVPCSPTRKIAIGIGKEKSDMLHVATVGTEDLIEFQGEELDGIRKKYQFSYSVSLAKVLDSELVFSKIVLIVPRYILINNMTEDILVKQYHCRHSEFLLEKNSRVPFHWPNAEMPEMIRIRVFGHWNWSGQFSLNNIGTFTVQNTTQSVMNLYLLINVEVKLVDRSFYVIFEKEDEKFCNYRIENHSQKIHLKAYQKGCKDEARYIEPNSLVSFAWTKPQKDNEIIVEFYEESFEESIPVFQSFSFNKINQSFAIELKNKVKIYAKIECEGPTKILKFSDNSWQSRKYEDDKIKTQYSISIPYMGISIIEYYNEIPLELMYFSALGITFFTQETSKQWAAELLVAYIQLDNQASVPAIYPVMLSPGRLEEKNALHISVFYSITNNPHIFCFDKCEFLMQEFALKLESKTLQKTIEMVTRLLYKDNAVISLHDTYKKYDKPVWMSYDKIQLNKLYYFAKLALSPIKIILSLIPIKEDNEESDVYGKVSKALGMAITTIELAPVKLNSLEMTDVFGSQWQILTAFKAHYGKQLIAELLSLIGHAEILGNPIGLLNKLGTGVKDFFYEPAQGIVHGPLSAGKGFIRGTGSLLKNTVEGTFDTVSKLANSMATGITTLTQDKEYLMDRQREQAMNKPRNIVDGVEMGVKSLIVNLGQGISGVVSQPVRGYKKDKFKGMIIGGVRGLSGLVVKPVAGVLDVASKAAEGIKRTAASNIFFGISERKRPPRVFYGLSSIMKIYNLEDSIAYSLIAEAKKGKYRKDKFFTFAEGYDTKGKQWFVYMFINRIVLFSGKKKKVKWEIPIKDINSCELESNGLHVMTKASEFGHTRGKTSFVFPISDVRINRFLLEKVTDLVRDN